MTPAGNTALTNIGPHETRKRLLMGIVMVVLGIVLAVFFSYAGVSPAWYLGLLLPFWMGTLGLSQARKKT